jgi:hypothetical protein
VKHIRRNLRIFALAILVIAVIVVGLTLSEEGEEPVPAKPPSRSSTTIVVKEHVRRQHHATTTTTTTFKKPTLAETLLWVAAVRCNQNYHLCADWPMWHALGQCEQGGAAPEGDGIAWHGQPIGGSPGSDYPGGLGIMAQAWTENRDASMPTNGAYATPGQQIEVARRIRARFGLRAWSCGQKLFPGM